MTYDQWKTTPPEERWGTDEQLLQEEAAENIEEMAMLAFYEWEPL